MRKLLENVFLIILSFALGVFAFFIIEQVISYTGKDYQAAIIGALGSLFGGSLTLLGVLWTLQNQAKTAFINEFPKRIRKLEEILTEIISLRDTVTIYKDILIVTKHGAFHERAAKAKILATDVDGICYFTVSKLDRLYDDYYLESLGVPKFEEERDVLNRPVLSKELLELEKKYKNKIGEILDELEEYSRELTDKFIRYKK